MELLLSKNETLVIDGDHRGETLLCTSGTLWVTQAGDARDYVLSVGKSLNLSGSGRVVAWALSDAALRCLCPVPAQPVGAPAKSFALVVR